MLLLGKGRLLNLNMKLLLNASKKKSLYITEVRCLPPLSSRERHRYAYSDFSSARNLRYFCVTDYHGKLPSC